MANTSVPKRAYLPEERSGVILLKSRCLIRLPQSLLAKRKSTLLDTNNSDLLGCGGGRVCGFYFAHQSLLTYATDSETRRYSQTRFDHWPTSVLDAEAASKDYWIPNLFLT